MSRILHQLRWKLTLSYTGVTVAALLVVELIFLVGAVGLFFWRLDILAGSMIDAASEDYTPSIRRHLVNSPPDQDGIGDWLGRFEVESTVFPLIGIFPITFETNELDVLVVATNGELLGLTPPDLLGDESVGRPLNAEMIPGLVDPLEAALGGETDTNRLYSSVEESHQLVMSVPVWDEDEEQVLGALVIIAPVPSTTEVLGDVAQILGVSVLCFTLTAGVIGTVFGFLSARGLVRRLNRVGAATLAWSQGDFKVFVDDLSEDELGQLARRLNYMAQELQNLLESRSALLVMEERNRLARDLHDSAKQQAFAAAAQISAGLRLLQTDPHAATTHLKEAEQLTLHLRQELTSLILELRPAALEGQGLAAAIKEYAADWSRQNEIPLDVRIQGERALPLAIEQTLFRLIQGALSNVARHSKATKSEIRLVYGAADISCIISDDGIGFSPSKQQFGFGLRSMNERVASLGGTMTVESNNGKGTQLLVTLPLSEANANA